MKELTIISGKGGTGKTTVTAALASLWDNKIMVDCDVDASNLHLLFNHAILEKHDFYSGYKAVLNLDYCSDCGKCVDVCRFDAIVQDEKQRFHIDELSCTGCGACTLVCKENVITLEDNLAGKWFISKTDYDMMVHAALGIAEDNSGKLVAKIREEAKNIAEEKNIDTIIIDGPPGIGCPVISSISGVNLVLIVTEPTLSGLHDLNRVLNLVQGFNIKSVVCINKYDINQEIAEQIISNCKNKNIPIIGKLPFNRKVVESMVNMQHQKSFIEHLPNELKNEFDKIKYNLIKELSNT